MGGKDIQRESLTLMKSVIIEYLVCTSHCSKHWRYNTCLHKAYVVVERWGQGDSQ